MACREARHRSESLFAMPRSAFGPLEDGVVSGFSGRMGRILRDEGERGHPNNHRTSRLPFERQPRRSPAAMLHSHIPKMADTSRATVRHTTLETACKLALALGVRTEDLLENDARESIDKWHSPAIPGIREQHERDRRPDGIGPSPLASPILRIVSNGCSLITTRVSRSLVLMTCALMSPSRLGRWLRGKPNSIEITHRCSPPFRKFSSPFPSSASIIRLFLDGPQSCHHAVNGPSACGSGTIPTTDRAPPCPDAAGPGNGTARKRAVTQRFSFGPFG